MRQPLACAAANSGVTTGCMMISATVWSAVSSAVDNGSASVSCMSILLSGDTAAATPRRQPALVLPTQHLVGVVHVEIDRTRPLAWTPDQRARTTAAILWLTRDPRLAERQIDLEVRRSERPVLLSLLADLRAALPRATLSMTALASWCDTERWISAAPVDQVVPMLFRMSPGGAGLRARLAAGGDLADPACRTALGVATDTALPLVPPGRRMFLFDPRPCTAADLKTRTGPP